MIPFRGTYAARGFDVATRNHLLRGLEGYVPRRDFVLPRAGATRRERILRLNVALARDFVRQRWGLPCL